MISEKVQTSLPASATARRLDRLTRWAQLSLLKLAGWILQQAGAWAPFDRKLQKALAPKIAKLGRFILALIVLKAGLRAKAAYATQRKKTGKAYGPRSYAAKHHLRRLLGSRLRKRRNPKLDLRAQIAALLTLLQDAETQIARFARRLARGFTRRQGGVPSIAFIPESLRFAGLVTDAANTS